MAEHQITDADDIVLPGKSLQKTLDDINTNLVEGLTSIRSVLDTHGKRITSLEARNHDADVAKDAVAAHKSSWFTKMSTKAKVVAAVISLGATLVLAVAALIVH